MTVKYIQPDRWIKYDLVALVDVLTEAKAAVMALTSMPYQRSWAETLQEMELKREVAGTSRIEGADFTERELDIALNEESGEKDLTRSQKQARAAKLTYKWIADLPIDRPIEQELILETHRHIVTGRDEDHCPPGELRSSGQNVTFGRPRHRGVEGGKECREAFVSLCGALNQEFRGHDPFIQALALHYQLGAMHPFLDGNGRTARALEALFLQRSRLKDELFISMSNYYYDEKESYLNTLTEVRKRNCDLTPFLLFGLNGIRIQCKRLLNEIKTQISKSLFRDVMGQMYGRLKSTKKRALATRQLAILTYLLEEDDPIQHIKLYDLLYRHYQTLKAPGRAYVRDLNYLLRLKAIGVDIRETGNTTEYWVYAKLAWPTEITETKFYEELSKLPEAKSKLVIGH